MWHAHDPATRAMPPPVDSGNNMKKGYAWAMFQGDADMHATADERVGRHEDGCAGGHVGDAGARVGSWCGHDKHGTGGSATRRFASGDTAKHVGTGAQRTALTIHSLMYDLVDGMFSYVAGMRNPQTKFVLELAKQADPDDIDMDVYCPRLHLTLGQIGALKMQHSKLASRQTRQNATERKMQKLLLEEANMESAGAQECGEPTGA